MLDLITINVKGGAKKKSFNSRIGQVILQPNQREEKLNLMVKFMVSSWHGEM